MNIEVGKNKVGRVGSGMFVWGDRSCTGNISLYLGKGHDFSSLSHLYELTCFNLHIFILVFPIPMPQEPITNNFL